MVFLYDSCLLSKPDLNLRRPLKGYNNLLRNHIDMLIKVVFIYLFTIYLGSKNMYIHNVMCQEINIMTNIVD